MQYSGSKKQRRRKSKRKKREDDKMYTFSQDTHRWLFFVHKASHLNLSWKEDSCNHIC